MRIMEKVARIKGDKEQYEKDKKQVEERDAGEMRLWRRRQRMNRAAASANDRPS